MDLFDLFAKISIDISGFESGINQAQKKFKDFSSNIKSISDGISNAYDGLGNALKPVVDGYKAVESVGQKAGNVVMDGLKGFAAASTVLGGFGVSAVKSGMEFDATMSQVSAISGATGQDFQDLRDKALEMGAKTKFSASEAAEAMTYMGMAGWKAGDMISGIEGIMNLAAASGEDLATTSDIVTDALTAFGLQAGDSGHFADVLAVASSNANTNVGLMGETFKYVAPVAGALGYSVDDTALAIGLMANSGIKATQAGTALRSIFTRLSTDAGASSQSLGALGVLTEKLGVEFYNLADGSARDLKDIINESRVAWAGLSEEEQISYAKTIAGQEAMSGWLALMNAAPEDVEKLTAALEDCNGAAQEMAATMVDNLQGDLTLLGSAFESLQIAISDSLTPTLREFAQFGSRAMANLLEGFQSGGTAGLMDALTSVVTEAVNMLMEHAPAFAEVSVQFISALGEGLIASAPNILTAAGEVITTLISGVSSFLNEYSTEMVEIGLNVIDLIASGFGDAIDVVTAHIGEFIPLIAEAFLLYHETLFTVGLDILGAIGQGIIENKDEIQAIASETITNMVTALSENAPMIIEGGLALLEALVGAIVENLPLIMGTGAQIVGELIAGISTASPGVQAIIATAVLPHILKIVEVVTSIGGAITSVAGLAGNAINTVIGIGSKLMGGIKLLFALIANHPVIAIVTGIIAIITLLWTHCEAFRDAVKGIMEAVGGFFQGAWETVQGIWSAAVEFFSGVVDGIKSAFDGIGEFLGELFTIAWELITATWDLAVDFFTTIADGIRAVFEVVTEFLGSAFSAAWDVVSGAWEAATDFFGGIFKNVMDKGRETAENVGNKLVSAYNYIKEHWDEATPYFDGLWGSIQDVFGNAWDAFKTIGSNMLEGLWNGIGDKIAWLKSKVSGVVDTIKSWFTGKDGFDEHSPSKWARQVFRYVMDGGVIGLDDGANALLREVDSITSRVKDGMTFSPGPVDLDYSPWDPRAPGNGPQSAAGGGSTFHFTFNSLKALNPVEAAREARKASQQIALLYV